mmetsp:Transcript_3264/g.3547  ORF Transcript_3264/g.3547 Transcript_3264/m.3547 type:complete len:826 (-) Transcript_3264:436-2913(-)
MKALADIVEGDILCKLFGKSETELKRFKFSKGCLRLYTTENQRERVGSFDLNNFDTKFIEQVNERGNYQFVLIKGETYDVFRPKASELVKKALIAKLKKYCIQRTDFKTAYKVLSFLEYGNDTKAYLASNRKDDSKVVLKLYHKPKLNTEEGKRPSIRRSSSSVSTKTAEEAYKLLMMEAIILRRLDHLKNIPKVLEVYDTDSKYILAMTYSRGKSLKYFLRKNKFMSEKMCRGMVRGLLQLLKSMHKRQIVHRDLNLSNLILMSQGGKEPQLHLVDFSKSTILDQSKEEETTTDSERFIGTPGYIAPEVLNGQPYSPNSDMFSLGCIVFKMMIGRNPFFSAALDIKLGKEELLENNKQFNLDFLDLQWNSISKAGSEFVQNLLNPLPTMRMGVKEAIRHPWILGKGGEAKVSMDDQFNLIKEKAVLFRKRTIQMSQKSTSVLTRFLMAGIQQSSESKNGEAERKSKPNEAVPYLEGGLQVSANRNGSLSTLESTDSEDDSESEAATAILINEKVRYSQKDDEFQREENSISHLMCNYGSFRALSSDNVMEKPKESDSRCGLLRPSKTALGGDSFRRKSVDKIRLVVNGDSFNDLFDESETAMTPNFKFRGDANIIRKKQGSLVEDETNQRSNQEYLLKSFENDTLEVIEDINFNLMLPRSEMTPSFSPEFTCEFQSPDFFGSPNPNTHSYDRVHRRSLSKPEWNKTEEIGVRGCSELPTSGSVKSEAARNTRTKLSGSILQLPSSLQSESSRSTALEEMWLQSNCNSQDNGESQLKSQISMLSATSSVGFEEGDDNDPSLASTPRVPFSGGTNIRTLRAKLVGS